MQPDYDDHEEEARLKPFPSSRGKEKSKDNKKYGNLPCFSLRSFVFNVEFCAFSDDPYYCGMRARVPNFVSKSKTKEPVPYKRFSISQQQHPHPQPPPLMHQHHMHPNPMWHARSFESGIGRWIIQVHRLYFFMQTAHDALRSTPSTLFSFSFSCSSRGRFASEINSVLCDHSRFRCYRISIQPNLWTFADSDARLRTKSTEDHVHRRMGLKYL